MRGDPIGGAGGSARSVAQQAAVVAEGLRKRAEAAARVSAAFSMGADGEETVARALTPLAAIGWSTLIDRQMQGGGNLDQIIMGPAGVAVIDAKNWSFPITVKDDCIYSGRYRRAKALDRILEQVEMVQSTLASLAFSVTVRGYLALVGEADRDRSQEIVRDVRVLGVNQLEAKFTRLKAQLKTTEIEEILRVLSLSFAPQSVVNNEGEGTISNPVAPVKVHKLFDRNTRFFYVRTWRKSWKTPAIPEVI